MDTNKPIKTAIGARLIFSYLPLALEAGQDHWFELSSSYCQFLEKLPLPDYFVPRVLNVVLRGDKLKEYLIEDTPTYIKHMFNMCGAVLGDGAFLTGDELVHETQYRGEKYAVWTEKWHCPTCDQDMPAFFFRHDGSCDACVLAPRIAEEIDHYKVEKRDLAASLYEECGAKLGDQMEDLRDNFHFGHMGFLVPASLENWTIDSAVQRAAQIDGLRALTTNVLQYVDRAEIHLLKPVGQALARVTRDRDWNDNQFVPKIDDLDPRNFEDRYLKAEDWDEMRRIRARKLEKAKAYCVLHGLPTDDEALRKTIRNVLANDWLKNKWTLDGPLPDDFF